MIAGFATWARRKPWATLLAGALAVALTLVLVLIQSLAQAQPANSTSYEVTAANASVQREVVGEVTASVDGVPAQPVDSFVWDGEGSTSITNARARLDIDPDSNTGTIRVTWKDRHGTWKLTQTAFSPPHHPTGLRLASAETTELVEDDPVTTDVYLHGDTTAGGPVLPTVFNLLATWGPGDVTLNGKPFENPFDGPAPQWAVHTMLTEGVRGLDGTVRTADGEIYDPTKAGEPGAVDVDDLEFHVVFHDAAGPEADGNFPPPFDFFYHLTFEDVKLDVQHAE